MMQDSSHPHSALHSLRRLWGQLDLARHIRSSSVYLDSHDGLHRGILEELGLDESLLGVGEAGDTTTSHGIVDEGLDGAGSLLAKSTSACRLVLGRTAISFAPTARRLSGRDVGRVADTMGPDALPRRSVGRETIRGGNNSDSREVASRPRKMRVIGLGDEVLEVRGVVRVGDESSAVSVGPPMAPVAKLDMSNAFLDLLLLTSERRSSDLPPGRARRAFAIHELSNGSVGELRH